MDDAVADPGGLLLKHLSAELRSHLSKHECVLFLDTQEVLGYHFNWHLLRLLSTLNQHQARLLVVVAGRFEPDYKLPNPAFAGWHETLRDKLKTEQFASNVRFTRTDVIELLRRLRCPSHEKPDLPDKILAVTLGIPMAVGMILRMHENDEDILSILSEFDPVDPSIEQTRVAQKVIGEVARRFLLHIEIRQRDEDLLRDVIFLTLTEGEWSEKLQELWWGGKQERNNRVLQLTRQVDFVDGGSIHPDPARYFKDTWMHQPHKLLPEVIDRANSLMEEHRAAAASSMTMLYSWLTTYSSLIIWRDSGAAYNARAQLIVLQLADQSMRSLNKKKAKTREWRRLPSGYRRPP